MPDENDASSNMASLNIRSSAKASLSRMKDDVDRDDFAPDQVEIEHRLERVEQQYARFTEHHLILVGAAQPGEMEAHDELMDQVDLLYQHIKLTLRRLLPAVTLATSGSDYESTRSHMADMRLDPVSIPTFDGQPENWLVFKDMFETLVHNRSDLDPTYKLGKLRQYVKAEAVPLVGGLYTGGYQEVWSELTRRYDNPRHLAETHVRRILDLPANPPDTQRTLRDIVDCVRNALRALAVMKLPVDAWDAIAVPILTTKLQTATRIEWGMGLRTSDIPRLDDLLTFVERRAMNMPVVSNTSFKRNTTPRSSIKAHVATTGQKTNATTSSGGSTVSCVNCSGAHRLTKCQRFKNLGVDERWNLVKKLQLCFNCLSKGHGSTECSSGNCGICSRRHNTLLCRGQNASNPSTPRADSSSQPSAVTPTTATPTPSTTATSSAPSVQPRQ